MKRVIFVSVLFLFNYIYLMAQTDNLVKCIQDQQGLDTIKKIVESGININEPDSHGWYPIIEASISEFEIVEYLVEKGVDVNVIQKDKQITALLYSLYKQKVEITKYLIEKGADINHQYQSGFTPLFYSIMYKCYPITKILISKGLDINMKVKIKNDKTDHDLTLTPLIIAITNDADLDFIKWLIANNADINVTSGGFNYDGSPVDLVDIASNNGLIEVARYLERLKRIVFISENSPNYKGTEIIIGNWDYGSGQYEEIKEDTKMIFICSLIEMEKKGDKYYCIFNTLNYDLLLDRHTSGPILVIFPSRPKINLNTILYLFCRYQNSVDSKDKKKIPFYLGDQIQLRPTRQQYLDNIF